MASEAQVTVVACTASHGTGDGVSNWVDVTRGVAVPKANDLPNELNGVSDGLFSNYRTRHYSVGGLGCGRALSVHLITPFQLSVGYLNYLLNVPNI